MLYAKPAYKMLAHNDTGRAIGHQGGPLVPKNIESYFPALKGKTSAANPTLSKFIQAELLDGNVSHGIVETRYQYQTWRAARSPERRITGNLQPLLGNARRDDILLMERDLNDPFKYRLTLLRKGTTEHTAIVAKVGRKRWGFL
jgi:putative restriction endonuclease